MDKYGVLWFWEDYINSLLKPRGLVFGKPICIVKTPYMYKGYFSVNSCKYYGEILVTFMNRGFTASHVYLRNKEHVSTLLLLTSHGLIFDKRHEFDWIHRLKVSIQ